jgi:hypothetical protein
VISEVLDTILDFVAEVLEELLGPVKDESGAIGSNYQRQAEAKAAWTRAVTKHEFRENRYRDSADNSDDTLSPRSCFTTVEGCWGSSNDD